MTTKGPKSLTEQRLTRRGAVRAGGLGVAALAGGATMKSAAAQEATPAAGQEA